MKEINKIGEKLFLFVLTSILLYAVMFMGMYVVKLKGRPASYTLCEGINWKGGNSYQKFKEFDSVNQKFDIVVLGSSHAYRSYDPRIFSEYGYSMFNLGTSAQTMMNSYIVAKYYLKPQTCSLVIIDVFDGALMSNGLESTADLIQNISSDRAASHMAWELKDPRCFTMLSMRWCEKNKPPFYLDSAYVGKGYSVNYSQSKNANSGSFYGNREINPAQLRYLCKTIAHLKTCNLKTVLVNGPLPNGWDYESHAEFSRELHSLAKTMGITYLDFGNKLKLDNSLHFYDAHHLNQHGVEVYDHFILKNYVDSWITK